MMMTHDIVECFMGIMWHKIWIGKLIRKDSICVETDTPEIQHAFILFIVAPTEDNKVSLGGETFTGVGKGQLTSPGDTWGKTFQTETSVCVTEPVQGLSSFWLVMLF